MINILNDEHLPRMGWLSHSAANTRNDSNPLSLITKSQCAGNVLIRLRRYRNDNHILGPNLAGVINRVPNAILAVGRWARIRRAGTWPVLFRRIVSLPPIALAIGAIVGLGSCASYRPSPLANRPNLAASLASLDATIPLRTDGVPARKILTTHPLTIDQIGLLAVLNDPKLKSESGVIDVAQAGLVQATLLPNPVGNFNYGALISGPATTSSIAASISQDFAAIITHEARVKSAEAHLYQVDAAELWREWQVAQKARQLALDIYFANVSIALTAREQKLLSRELVQVRKAIAQGNLTLTALAPLLTASATTEQSLMALRLGRLKNWQALDGLLGLIPDVRFVIVRPTFAPLPPHLEALLADLPERRPDLTALGLGYRSAEEDVRAAILGQFPGLALGASYGSDTSAVVSAGPSFTFALPIFDRNQGQIAKTRATRLLLSTQYQARLNRAVANVHALSAQIRQLSIDLVRARKAATAARSLAETAQKAYAQNNLDQRSLTDYETTALERALQVVTIERQIGEDKIFLAVELGLGLPQARIALSGRPSL